MFKVPMLPRSLEAVCRDLTDSNPRVRLSAIQESPRHAEGPGRSRVRQLLVSILTEGPSALRAPVLLALADGQMSEAIDSITPLLRDGDPETRRCAILALGELAPDADGRALLSLSPFLTAADPRIRYQTVAAIAAIAGPEAFEMLASAASDSDPLIRELAARLVDETLVSGAPSGARERELLGRLALDTEARVRAVAQVACHERGFEAPTDAVIQLIDGKFRGREARDLQDAIEVAGRLRLRAAGKGLQKRAFGFLGFSTDPFRWHARAALATLGHERARRSVERCLKRGSRIERAAMIFALGRVRATEFASEIRGQAEDPDLRPSVEQALLALGRKDP